MLRSIVGKVAWVGRTAATVLGLALVLALVFGVATAAIGATGGNFILGKPNAAGTPSSLTASIAKPTLTLINKSTDVAATALNISVASGKAPIKGVHPAQPLDRPERLDPRRRDAEDRRDAAHWL